MDILAFFKDTFALFKGKPFYISASSLYLGFLIFEHPLLVLLVKGDCLSRLWGL